MIDKDSVQIQVLVIQKHSFLVIWHLETIIFLKADVYLD